MIPQLQLSHNDQHFTLLGLNSLSGLPVTCVVIFSGKWRNPVLELGVDPFVEEEGSQKDSYYMIKNMGNSKQFPGGPTCEFCGKKIPCLCAWSPKVLMTSYLEKYC